MATDLKKYYNKFIYQKWTHNEGYNSRWLRRINRTTKTQIISDCQRTSTLDDTGMYAPLLNCAQRFNIKNGEVAVRLSHRANTDGVRENILVEDFSILKCEKTFEEVFETDYREIYKDNKEKLEEINDEIDSKIEHGLWKEERRHQKYIPTLHEYKSDNEIWGATVEHLQELFGELPVFKIGEFGVIIDTIHDRSIFTDTVTHYHITVAGGDKIKIGRKEHQKNRTISFWVFDDRIVFKHDSGISCW